MKSKKGIFLSVTGVVCILVSKSSIFTTSADMNLLRSNTDALFSITAVSFLIFSCGITLLLIGAYQFTSQDDE